MGTVFKAQRHDGHFEQVAAIKLLRGLPSSEALARLAQERQILRDSPIPISRDCWMAGPRRRGNPIW
jgi:hypothetical protein